MITFEVLGVPAPQGSKTRMPNGAMLDGGSKGARDKHKNWRSAVADTARDVAQHADVPAPFSEPVHVTVAFRFPMPKGRLKRLQSDSGVAWKRSTPDIDKIIRSTLDGLVVGGLLSDDKVVCELSTSKVETVGWTGAEVWIERLPSVPS